MFSLVDHFDLGDVSSVTSLFDALVQRRCLAAIRATLTAVGAAFAAFFGDETTAEGCETVDERCQHLFKIPFVKTRAR